MPVRSSDVTPTPFPPSTEVSSSKVAAKAITLPIRQQFGHPWPTWRAIPKDHQELFFQRFKEEFEARLSQARSYATSSVGKSQLTPLNPAEEQRLRTQYWVVAAGPKRKGRLYDTRDLVHTYKCGDDNFMHHMQGSSSHSQDATKIHQLGEEFCQSKEEMCVFQSVVLQFLPKAQNIIQQPHQ
ncbi:hypothetical protein GmHk_20G057464 [Glycine max]|nr:hypothetical protein GmHk_20G057464 [Glycine max]